MKYFTVLGMILAPMAAKADVNCKKNPIYCNIVKLKPSVDKKFARDLANSIYKYSKMFDTDPAVSVAIAMQESSFENKNRIGSILTKDGRVVQGATDVGVFQIHIRTISNLQNDGEDLDFNRLESDVDYQTYWHAKILKKKIVTCLANRSKLAVSPGNEWSCYHSFTPSKRMVYLRDVGAHLAKLASR